MFLQNTDVFIVRIYFADNDSSLEIIQESGRLKTIPCTQNNYRLDKGNMSTKTQDHVHVFYKTNKQLFAVNRDGSAHDSSHQTTISKPVANFLRNKLGFDIPTNNMIETMNFSEIDQQHTILLESSLFDSVDFK
jgi:hypothetical protein